MHTLRNIHARLTTVLITVVLLCFAFLVSSFAGDRDAEYRLKAAFLYNFTQYFEWEEPTNEIVIGVLGPSPVYGPLVQIAGARSTATKKITVKHFASPKDITACHIIFISRTVSLEDVLPKISKGTLTVTEKPGCGAQGAAINFIIVNNKLKFESNLKAINAAGVKASSQLLKLAIIVG